MSIRPLTLDIAFPSLADVVPDKKQAEIISPAYAAPKSELSAILQYVYHNFNFNSEGFSDISFVYESIFVCEMTHLEHLGSALIKLGVDPIFVAIPPMRMNFFTTSHISYSRTPKQMLLDDMNGEINAIEAYRSMSEKLGDSPIGALIRRITMDEELHLKTLKDLYAQIASK